MSATEALKQASSVGLLVRIDGDALALDASAPPPAAVLDLLVRYKADILTLLRPGEDGWTGQDWQDFFEERTRVAELKGGLKRNHAEDRAFLWCVDEWLNRNPASSLPGRCHYCGQSEGTLLPYLTSQAPKDPAHTWLHQECSRAWQGERKRVAIAALRDRGITIHGNQQNGAEREEYE